jgi:hypothetical protein
MREQLGNPLELSQETLNGAHVRTAVNFNVSTSVQHFFLCVSVNDVK